MVVTPFRKYISALIHSSSLSGSGYFTAPQEVLSQKGFGLLE